ncbi:heme-binding domain-containing protein [Nitratifractor salsuginis]|uniref:Cytochrome c n=1 Tax=Nitratifractor salsuginis (strain DSM 16511 / JCM 12458 / E9I37-1) TaxID=749222 RepID=E6X023_NITSE|nr:heme-binding domain-containing protein [Nitratifractor salsuginis]ADV46746.1 cytochrome c [Nitratifractor salsuginis DSM 16511]
MKTLKVFLGWLIAGLLLIQFIQIKVPEPPKAKPGDEIKAPKEIMALLKRSCYDCHSNHTDWPWYSHISPVSLEVKSHVKEGRAWLNFSIWNQYSEEKKQKLYKDIAKSIDWQMPPEDYLWMHDEAKLTPQERQMIKKWALSHVKEDEE